MQNHQQSDFASRFNVSYNFSEYLKSPIWFWFFISSNKRLLIEVAPQNKKLASQFWVVVDLLELNEQQDIDLGI